MEHLRTSVQLAFGARTRSLRRVAGHRPWGSVLKSGKKWRRGWDLNPRYGFPYARFRGEYFQPLSHLSAVVADFIVAERYVFRQSGADTLTMRCGADLILFNGIEGGGMAQIAKRTG